MILLSAVDSPALVIVLSILCVALAVGIGVMATLIAKSKKKDKEIMKKDVYNSENNALNIDCENNDDVSAGGKLTDGE